MQIGSYSLTNNLILAPMAGITDRPFRELCKQFGAGLAVSEMVASNPALRHHKRTLLKSDHIGETGIRTVQILGTDPHLMPNVAPKLLILIWAAQLKKSALLQLVQRC